MHIQQLFPSLFQTNKKGKKKKKEKPPNALLCQQTHQFFFLFVAEGHSKKWSSKIKKKYSLNFLIIQHTSLLAEAQTL